MNTVTLDDGRTVAYAEWGDPSGRPLFSLHGTPGCRFSRHPDPRLWSGLGLRVITLDRPGYARSTPLPGRRVAHAAHDVGAVADALGVERFLVIGGSGGGPHALACAAGLGDRVTACAAVASAAPLTSEEVDHLIGLNRESYRVYAARGRQGMAEFLAGLRSAILADPSAAMSGNLSDAPRADVEWYGRPEVQAVHRESLLEALRPGIQGWVDDAVSVFHDDWGVDVADIACQVRFWHGDDDRNGPLAAVERLAATIRDARVRIWHGQGHSAPARHMTEILTELTEAAG
jgi:pimeloyl-ACP methyl ester carboxylesterase